MLPVFFRRKNVRLEQPKNSVLSPTPAEIAQDSLTEIETHSIVVDHSTNNDEQSKDVGELPLEDNMMEIYAVPNKPLAQQKALERKRKNENVTVQHVEDDTMYGAIWEMQTGEGPPTDDQEEFEDDDDYYSIIPDQAVAIDNGEAWEKESSEKGDMYDTVGNDKTAGDDDDYDDDLSIVDNPIYN